MEHWLMLIGGSLVIFPIVSALLRFSDNVRSKREFEEIPHFLLDDQE